MNQDEFLRMAREAGFPINKHLSGRQDIAGQSVARFRRFAALVAAAEREACAKVCEGPGWNATNWCAVAIRARNNA